MAGTKQQGEVLDYLVCICTHALKFRLSRFMRNEHVNRLKPENIM